MNKSSYRLVWFIPALVGCPLMVGSTGEDREKQCKTTFWGDVDCKTTFWGDVDSQTSRYLQRRPPLPLLRMKLNLPLFYEVNILVFFAFFATANPSPRQPEATAWNPKMLCSASELLHPTIPSSATSHGTSRSGSAGERSGVWTRSGPFSRCTLWCPNPKCEASTDPLTSTPSCGTPAEPSPHHPGPTDRRRRRRTHRCAEASCSWCRCIGRDSSPAWSCPWPKARARASGVGSVGPRAGGGGSGRRIGRHQSGGEKAMGRWTTGEAVDLRCSTHWTQRCPDTPGIATRSKDATRSKGSKMS